MPATARVETIDLGFRPRAWQSTCFRGMRRFSVIVLSNRDDEIIVRSTIELGHNMNLKVVAEGVETAEVLARLGEFGCDIAQGYLLSKPLPPAAFADWLAQTQWTLPRLGDPESGGSGRAG